MMTSKLGLLAPVAVAAIGQDAYSLLKRFELFNNCQPMRLLVEDLPDAAADIGLTEERLVLAAESRLRGSRLYTAEGAEGYGAYLYLRVNVVGNAFSIALDYRKNVRDLASGDVNAATTWHAGSTGTHGRNVEYIVSGVSRYLDQFLTEYLRVNEAACSAR